jgi:hypothetical protein
VQQHPHRAARAHLSHDRRQAKAVGDPRPAALGVALIAMPVAFQMFDRAPKGARMIKDLRPYMTPARLSGHQTEMAQIDAGVREGATNDLTGRAGHQVHQLAVDHLLQWHPPERAHLRLWKRPMGAAGFEPATSRV